MAGPLNSSTVALHRRYERADRSSVVLDYDSESSSIVPPILVSVLIICIFAALSGTLGMLLYTVLRRML